MKKEISRRDFIKGSGKGLLGGIIVFGGISTILRGLVYADAVQAVRVTLKSRAEELRDPQMPGTPVEQLEVIKEYVADNMMYTRRILKESFGGEL